jgi:hypothetical protein
LSSLAWTFKAFSFNGWLGSHIFIIVKMERPNQADPIYLPDAAAANRYLTPIGAAPKDRRRCRADVGAKAKPRRPCGHPGRVRAGGL